VRVHTVVLSAQHDAQVTPERMRRDLVELVAKPVLASEDIDSSATLYHVNPSAASSSAGRWGTAG